MTIRWIRWFLVMPASILSLLVVFYLVVLLSFIPLLGADDGREAYLVIFGMFLANYTFVMAGAITAPSHRLSTALVLAAVLALFPAQYLLRSLIAGIFASRPVLAMGFCVSGFGLACIQLGFYRWHRSRRANP